MKRGTWSKSPARVDEKKTSHSKAFTLMQEQVAVNIIKTALAERGGIMDAHSESEITRINQAIDVLINKTEGVTLGLTMHEQTQLATWMSTYRKGTWVDGKLVPYASILRDRTLAKTQPPPPKNMGEALLRSYNERHGIWSDDD